MKMISLNCPKCGASLSTEEDREYFFCQNCGNKIILQNENEYIIRHIEDPVAIQAKTDQYVQMKKLEMLEKLQAKREQGKKGKILLSVILAMVGAALGIVGVVASVNAGELNIGPIFSIFAGIIAIAFSFVVWDDDGKYEDEVARLEGKVKVPNVFSEIEKKKYQQIESAFRNAGFTNVTCQKRKDLAIGVRHKFDSVDTVMINGEEISSGGHWYPPDSPVVIIYHATIWSRD